MVEITHKDIVIDTNVMRLYASAKDKTFKVFFRWLRFEGTLTMSRKLLTEYGRSNQNILILVNELQRKGRYNLISNDDLQSYDGDRHFNYTCNYKDKLHARLVFLSKRKRLISFDIRLSNDVNSYKRIEGIKPCACNNPRECCYE